MRMNDFFKAHRVLWVLIAIMAIFALAMVGCGGDADDDDDDDVETPVTPPPPPPEPGSMENPYALTEGDWAALDSGIDCTFAERDTSAQIWFKIDVTEGTKYNVFWDDSYSAGSGYCEADIRVRANYQGESTYLITGNQNSSPPVPSPLGDPANSASNVGADTGYTSAAIGSDNGGKTFTANKNGTVLIRVIQEPGTSFGKYPDDTTAGNGEFDIVYTTANTTPSNIKPVGPNRSYGVK